LLCGAAHAQLPVNQGFTRKKEDPRTPDELFQEGIRLRLARKLDDASRAFSLAITKDPSYPRAHLARGLVQVERILFSGSEEWAGAAVKDLSEALRQDPGNQVAHAARGFCRALLGYGKGARRDIDRATRSGGRTHPLGLAALGQLSERALNTGEAVRLYQIAAGGVPPESMLSRWLARRLDALGPPKVPKLEGDGKAEARRRRSLTDQERELERRYEERVLREKLFVQLDSPDPGLRAAAARGLVEVSNDFVVRRLMSSLADPDPAARAMVIEALGNIGSARAVHVLLPFLQHDNRLIRAVTVRALGRIGSERGKEPLEKLFQTEQDDIILMEIQKSLKSIEDAAFNMKFDLDHLMDDLDLPSFMNMKGG